MPPESTEYVKETPPSALAAEASDALFSDAYSRNRKLEGRSGSSDGGHVRTAHAQQKAEDIQLKATPEVKRDGEDKPQEVTTPHGDRYQISYDGSGKPTSIAVTHPSGRPDVYEWTRQGWKVNGAIDYDLSKVEVFQNGSIKTTHLREGSVLYHPNGSAEGRDWDDRPSLKIAPDGTRTTYNYDDRITTFGTRLVEKPGSPLAEIKSTFGDFNDGYVFTDKAGHKERLERRDRAWELTRGHKTERFPMSSELKFSPNGDRKITRPDGSSFEGKADGTTFSRNTSNQITEMTSPTGITTTFRYGDKDKVVGIEVKDACGRIIESQTSTAQGWQSSLTDAAGKPLAIKEVTLDQKTGKCDLVLENGRISRSPEGAESQKDRTGNSVEDYDDKVVKWTRRADLGLSQSQEAALKADLAVINKLPAENKAWILLSFDQLINGNADAKTDLSKAQRAELAMSLAHQIAHPESITQGGKHATVMASAERMMAATQPDKYARMIVDLAIEGKCTTPDGKVVKAQKTREGFLEGKSDSYNLRTLTSELFQNAAANIALEREGKTYKSALPGSDELKPTPAGINPLLDTGERVTDREGRVVGFDGLNREQREALLVSIGLNGNDAGSIKSSQDLLAAWQGRTDKSAPLSLAIRIPKDVGYFTEGWKHNQEVNPELHVVTITHIDTSTSPALVYFDNTAGGADHSYPKGRPVVIWDLSFAHTAAPRNGY